MNNVNNTSIERNILVVMYDKLADNYSAPYLFANEASAKRWFANIYKNNTKPFSDNMSDYELYVIGTFSVDTGVVTAYDKPKLIMKGNDCVLLGGNSDAING